MKLLVSVRSVDEALAAAAAGADFIDLKEPSAGALGALPIETTRAIVAALRARPGPPCRISATIGDVAPGAAREPVLARVAATAACGVDYVKVGLAPTALPLLDALAHCDATVVPVLIADAGLDETLLARALAGPFPALMLDTEDKQGGSLLQRLGDPALQHFIARCASRTCRAWGRWRRTSPVFAARCAMARAPRRSMPCGCARCASGSRPPSPPRARRRPSRRSSRPATARAPGRPRSARAGRSGRRPRAPAPRTRCRAPPPRRAGRSCAWHRSRRP